MIATYIYISSFVFALVHEHCDYSYSVYVHIHTQVGGDFFDSVTVNE